MSVSKNRYTERCDSVICAGSCDICSIDFEEFDDIDLDFSLDELKAIRRCLSYEFGRAAANMNIVDKHRIADLITKTDRMIGNREGAIDGRD